MKSVKSRIAVAFLILLFVACGTPAPEAQETPETTATPAPITLRVMTYDSFSISEEVIAQFEAEHNATVQFLKAGDTGAMLNQAILSRDNPQADVLYGVDNTFLSRALEADIYVPYEAENLAHIPDHLKLDPEHRVVPTDFGDVCLNYDKAYFEEHDLPIPQSLQDLTKPEYKGLLVVENPASSSPGLAFLITTIGVMGASEETTSGLLGTAEGATYLDFWAALRENDVLVVDGWDTAYYSEFSGGSGSEGARPLVVSYATSPAAEVYFSDEELASPPTGAITAPQTCFRQIEFAGILKNGQHRELAEEFIEFLLSESFQEDIPLQMWVFPAREDVTLPEVFAEHAQVAEEPVEVPYATIEENRAAWIEAWTEVVLR
ncbi:MAG: thiamine ABC transporter substrate binding subunit [Anaerolineales bacterium]